MRGYLISSSTGLTSIKTQLLELIEKRSLVLNSTKFTIFETIHRQRTSEGKIG